MAYKPQEAPRKSLDEIAAMMAENTMRMRQEREEAGVPVDEPEVVDEDKTDDVDVDTGDSGGEDVADTPAGDEAGVDDQDDDDDLESEVDGTDEADGEAADDDDEVEDTTQLGDEFEIGDDDLLEVGDDETVSIGKLKAMYNADKHILAKIEEQENAVKGAAVERAKALEDSQKAAVAVKAVFQHITNIATQPLVSAPDEALKQDNPARYIAHLEAYQQDQERIEASKQDLAEAMEAHAQQQKELKENYKRAELVRLQKHVPALVSQDETVRKTASQDILNAAERYGFTPEEVNEAVDSRIYWMAHDAAQYHKLMNGGKLEQENVERKLKKRVTQQTRTLRSRGTTAKNRLSTKAKQIKILKAKAKQTGHVDDIAAVLAAEKTM